MAAVCPFGTKLNECPTICGWGHAAGGAVG
jgi:hypothetical protein